MSVKLKVCTFNLRTPVKDDGINYFPNRTGRILDVIKEENPDLIGFQEVADMTRKWLRDALTDYIVVGCGRDKGLKGESMVIAYRRNCFDMISMDTFWLSTAPSVPGSRYGVDQSGCARATTAVVLKHDDFEKPFLFLNTHLDHQGQQARMFGAIQILQYISEKNLPFVLTGDMNALPQSPEMQALVNCKYRAVVDITAGIDGTFHNYGRRATMSKIDYIFTDMQSDAAESYAYNDVPVEGLYVSDHLPVFGFVTLGE